MKLRTTTSLLVFLACYSLWVTYSTWRSIHCHEQVLDLLSVSVYDQKMKRKLSLGELLQSGTLDLVTCHFDHEIEVSWQAKASQEASLDQQIKLVDKVSLILYFKTDHKIYSWATGPRPLSWKPISLSQIKSLVER